MAATNHFRLWPILLLLSGIAMAKAASAEDSKSVAPASLVIVEGCTPAGTVNALCEEIKSEYQRLASAFAQKNLDAIGASYDPAYSALQVNGEAYSLKEYMAAWQALMDGHYILRWSVDRVEMQGNEAVALARSTVSSGRSPTPAYRAEAATREYWVKTDGRWRTTRAETLREQVWKDGKMIKDTEAVPPLTEGERSAIVRDIAADAHAFKTVLAGNGFDDLAFLDQMIGDARIVSLGEASHGTAEFFQMKHRLLEYLVENKGFTVFAIEANWPEALVADRYIKTGGGDAAAALKAMYFWTWQTEEVHAMLEWMRSYNAKRGDKPALSFSAFDMQYANVAAKKVEDLFARLGGADYDIIQELYADAQKLGQMSREQIEASGEEKLRELRAKVKIDSIKAQDLIKVRREALIRVSTQEDYEDALQAARIVSQAAEANSPSADGSYFNVRDTAMAENVRWLAEKKFPGQKIVLWAHNGHVQTALSESIKPMGVHLRDTYGLKMVVLGFASYAGTVRAIPIVEGKGQRDKLGALPLEPAKPSSIDGLFEQTGLPRFVLDLRRVQAGSALATWTAKPRLHRSIGAGFDPAKTSYHYQETDLPNAFDGLIFVSQVTAAKPLP